MPKSMTGLIVLVTSSLFVFSLGAQERDDSRLKPAERNRTGTLNSSFPAIMSSLPPALTAELSPQAKGLSSLTP